MSQVTGAQLPEGRLTDELIASMRAKAGTELRIDHSIYNEEATWLAIAKFVAGIGDPNPLWTDRSYAAASPYQGLVAPPSWVIAVFSGLQFGWPGLGAFHSSSTLRFHRPVQLGDRIVPRCVYRGFDGPRPSRFAEAVVVDRFANTYRNQRGELVAEIDWEVVNFERARARERSNGDGDDVAPVPHRWTEEEVQEIESAVLAEAPRGPTPRRWEDVGVGDELDGITKGPIGMTDEIAFVSGGGAPIPRLAAHGVALRNYRLHPSWAFRDDTTGALEPIYAVHYNQAAAKAMGVPLQYDVGFQRQCWQIHLLTNWIGDHGWVKSVAAEYRKFVFHGDVVHLTGAVASRYVDADGDACVDVVTSARNQRGEEVMPGTATIALPRADGDPVSRRRIAS